MKRILLSFFCAVFLLTFLLGLTSLFAQNATNNSRLNLKRNQSAYIPKLPILLAKRSFKVKTSLETNLDIKSNNYISQFLKSNYATTLNTKSDNQTDKKIIEDSESENYLLVSDKLVVGNLYPNPANEYVDVDYQILGPVNEVKISFFNILGQVVKELILEKDQKNVRINLRDLNSGLYIYQLEVDGRSLVSKKLILRKG